MASEQRVKWQQPIGSVQRLWFQGPPFENWAFVVRAGHETYLVDTGNPGLADELIARLEEEGIRPDAILLTHHHETHAANAPTVARHFGCPVWAHEESAPLCRQAGVDIDRTFTADQVFGGALQVIDAPGHAPGNVAFYYSPPEEASGDQRGVILAGDVVMGLGPSEEQPLCLPGGSDAAKVRADANNLLSLKFDALLPAHGRHIETDGPARLRSLLDG